MKDSALILMSCNTRGTMSHLGLWGALYCLGGEQMTESREEAGRRHRQLVLMEAKEGGKRDRVGVWCPQGSGGRQFPGGWCWSPTLNLLIIREGEA